MKLRIARIFASTASISRMPQKCSMDRSWLGRTREDYGEERWIGVGMTKGRVAFVAFTVESHETIRIISLRKATIEERQDYETAIDDGLEAN
jgi:uncharacterized DUF497 family protein